MDTRACQSSHEEICDKALRHYEKLAKECCHWNSLIPKAIEYYKINKKEISMSKEKERTYEFNMDCDNCGGYATMNIPWGTTIDDFKISHDGICPDCGCLMKESPLINNKESKMNKENRAKHKTILRRKANIKCDKGWLRISALGNREKNIRLEFIKQVRFEKNEISIQINEGGWTTIRAYNHQTIEEYIENRKKTCEDYWDYCEKDEKAENFTEAINLEREWIEALGKNIPLPKAREIGWWFRPGTEDYYLKDEDFNKLSDRLNQLIDDYAIEEEKE